MHKKIAVLLASYNGSKWICNQIDSILNQKGVDVSIFISDDMSTDDTIATIQHHYKDNAQIILLKNIGKIGGAAKNFYRLIKDVDFSKFDYISFADQDDIWYDNKLLRAINMIEDKHIDVYSGNVIAFWENGKKVFINKSQAQKKYDFLFSSAGPGCTYVMTKQFLSNFKNHMLVKCVVLDKMHFHDWLLYAYARTHNYKWYIDCEASMMYRQHKNNEFGANSGMKVFKKRWSQARNGWYREQILNVAKFCDYENKITTSIEKNSFMDKLYLIGNLFKLRRKMSEAVMLFFILLIPGFR